MTLKDSPLNNGLMVMAAHRYCLGRRSYIVGACIQFLVDNWEQFQPHTQQVIVRDTAEALMDGFAGSSATDTPLWRDFLRWSQVRIPELGLRWARESLLYKQKPWPVDIFPATNQAQSDDSQQSSMDLGDRP